MTIPQFIATLPAERQAVLTSIHDIILREDKSVTAVIGTMMKVEMIIYNAPGTFKYGLSSVKNYMSLHAMPIYMTPALHSKYKALLSKANFQKGCINFNSAEEMPLDIVQDFIKECSPFDLRAIRESYQQSKTKSKTKKA